MAVKPLTDAELADTNRVALRFYLPNGELSEYGLACGYVQAKQVAPDFRVELFRDGGAYHVQAFDQANHRRVTWDVFERLTKARACWRKLIREYRA